LAQHSVLLPTRKEEIIMNVKEIKEIADRMGLDAGKMKKNDLIRTIQRTEGNPECFDTGKAAECGEYDCLWRTDCK